MWVCFSQQKLRIGWMSMQRTLVFNGFFLVNRNEFWLGIICPQWPEPDSINPQTAPLILVKNLWKKQNTPWFGAWNFVLNCFFTKHHWKGISALTAEKVNWPQRTNTNIKSWESSRHKKKFKWIPQQLSSLL